MPPETDEITVLKKRIEQLEEENLDLRALLEIIGQMAETGVGKTEGIGQDFLYMISVKCRPTQRQ